MREDRPATLVLNGEEMMTLENIDDLLIRFWDVEKPNVEMKNGVLAKRGLAAASVGKTLRLWFIAGTFTFRKTSTFRILLPLSQRSIPHSKEDSCYWPQPRLDTSPAAKPKPAQ